VGQCKKKEIAMIKLAKILYPTDFSEVSLTALNYAKDFAQQYNAQLHCLHILDEAYQYWLALGPDGVPAGPDMNQLMSIAQDQMNKLTSEHLSDVPKLITKIVSGRPFLEIIRYAREQAVDMIIIATHGRSGLSHALMGSVAERVVRKAPCPVLTVRSGEHEFIMP
jgi:nucleotide-binding universal stress UspA family protein